MEESVGQEFVQLWVKLLQKTLTFSEEVDALFETMHGFQILAGFLCQANPDFLYPNLPQDLVNLFEMLTLFSLKVQMVEYIWMDFDVAARFGSLHDIFFSSLMVAYQISRDAFHSIVCFDSLVYQTVTRFPQGESANFLWGLIERFLYDRLHENIFPCLVSICLLNFDTTTSVRALGLVRDVIQRFEVSVPDDLYPGLLELLRVPALQPYVFSILERVPDLNTLSALLARAVENMSMQNAPMLTTRLQQYVDQPNGWIYLPLFVACVCELEFQEAHKLASAIAQQIIENPEKFSKFSMLSSWFVCLFRLFTECQLERFDFSLAFARLIDQQIDAYEQLFLFLASRDDTRWLRSQMFKYLLRPEAMSWAKWAALCDAVFDYLFVQFAGTDHLHIVLDLSGDGQWNDMDTAERFLHVFDCERRISDPEIAHKVAYVVAQLIRFGKPEHMQLILKLNGDADMIYTATRIVSHVADLTGRAAFEGFGPVFDDDLDSNALQLYLFESKLLDKLPQMRKRWKEATTAREKERISLLEKVVDDREQLLYPVVQFQEALKAKIESNRADRNRAVETFLGGQIPN
jgi:hypothetical protein